MTKNASNDTPNQNDEKIIYKSKGDEIAATGKCDGECPTPHDYSTVLSEEDANKLKNEVFSGYDKELDKNYDSYNSIDDRIKKLDTIPNVPPTKEQEEILKEVRLKSKKRLDLLNFRDEYGNKTENCETEINFKLTVKEKEQIKLKAKEYGFKNLSDYMRIVLLNAKIDITHDTKNICDEEKDICYFLDKFSKMPTENNAKCLKVLVDSYTIVKLLKTKE